MTNVNPHIGSSFADFLDEEDIRDDVTAEAIKRVLAWQLQQEMATKGLSKTAMAQRMATSRSQLNRLLDPTNPHVELATIQRAAVAVGRTLHIELR